ncbi:MAG: AIR synthase related protein [Alphaproteobacteria bacterium]
MDEHARIAQFLAPLAEAEPGALGLKDDAALLRPPPGKTLVVTTDSVIAGHPCPDGRERPQQVAVKLMRRNLSDLAAMGAAPWRYTLNLHTPKATKDAWFAKFAGVLAAEQQRFGLTLIGGDCTSGTRPIHATMTCFGLIEGKPLLRSGAKAGDILYASGTIGDAALDCWRSAVRSKSPPQRALPCSPATRLPSLASRWALPSPASPRRRSTFPTGCWPMRPSCSPRATAAAW